MRVDTKQRIMQLSAQVAVENDPAKFLRLIEELNQALEQAKVSPTPYVSEHGAQPMPSAEEGSLPQGVRHYHNSTPDHFSNERG